MNVSSTVKVWRQKWTYDIHIGRVKWGVERYLLEKKKSKVSTLKVIWIRHTDTKHMRWWENLREVSLD